MFTTRPAPVRIALIAAATMVAAATGLAAPQATSSAQVRTPMAAQAERPTSRVATTSLEQVQFRSEQRFQDDLQAMQMFRPGYAFWQHVFRIPDGSIAYGSATDGRLLAVFPARGDWSREGILEDPRLKPALARQSLPTTLADRREEVARLLESAAGPIVHNPTRGLFVAPNAERYGRFIEDWSRIYERFGVPAELGLAQGLVESGLNGTVRSEARAIGFCQWLMTNWNVLKRMSSHVIEGYNQTTQAPYCAAYLSVLGTKYGSFIPALSEHHAGGTNVGRTIDNGQRLGGRDVREYYFLGADFTRDLRTLSPRSYSDVYGTYGPRSFYYAEMVFGNTTNIQRILETQRQVRVFAMRTARAISMTEIARRTRLSADEIRRLNPALLKQVPAHGTVYLPVYIESFGENVTFWHRPAPRAYTDVLAEFISLNRRPDEWDSGAAVPALRSFEKRFRSTRSEEGTVMATVLNYVIQEILTSGRGAILEEFRNSAEVRHLFEQAVIEREAARGSGTNP